MIDTSALRRIESSAPLCDTVARAIDLGTIVVVVSRTISEQLWRGQAAGHGEGVPPFDVKYVGNTVAVLGLLRCGDSLGRGDIYRAHLGKATNDGSRADALIVDAASMHADLFVTDDNRQHDRAARELPARVTVFKLDEFVSWLSAQGV
jgi:hypothetical protein